MTSMDSNFTFCYLCALIILLAHMIPTSRGGETINNKAEKGHFNYRLE